MRCKSILALILVFGFCSFGRIAGARQVGGARPIDKPLSKSEIIAMLKQSGSAKMSQGDIAALVFRRGISFALDDTALEEIRQAGAEGFLVDTIKRAGELAEPADDRPRLKVRTSDSDREPDLDQETDQEARSRARAETLARMPLIEQARYHALDFARDLPNFIVTQQVTRSVQHPGTKNWRVQDRLDVQLTYRAEKGEEYKLISIDGKPARQTYEELGGSTSAGEFGSFLASLFAPPSRAEFREIKHETFRGRDTVIYDFSVRKANSTVQITDKDTNTSVITAYKGSLWIDTETRLVLRVESSSFEIGPGFPITLAENSVEYDWVTIAGERYLLPVEAEVLLGRDRDRYYSKNVIEFRNYHKYEGEVKLVPDSN